MKRLGLLLIAVAIAFSPIWGQVKVTDLSQLDRNVESAVMRALREHQKKQQMEHDKRAYEELRNTQAAATTQKEIMETQQIVADYQNNYRAEDYTMGPDQIAFRATNYNDLKDKERDARISALEEAENNVPSDKADKTVQNQFADNPQKRPNSQWGENQSNAAGESLFDQMNRRAAETAAQWEKEWIQKYGTEYCKYRPNECVGGVRRLPPQQPQYKKQDKSSQVRNSISSDQAGKVKNAKPQSAMAPKNEKPKRWMGGKPSPQSRAQTAIRPRNAMTTQQAKSRLDPQSTKQPTTNAQRGKKQAIYLTNGQKGVSSQAEPQSNRAKNQGKVTASSGQQQSSSAKPNPNTEQGLKKGDKKSSRVDPTKQSSGKRIKKGEKQKSAAITNVSQPSSQHKGGSSLMDIQHKNQKIWMNGTGDPRQDLNDILKKSQQLTILSNSFAQ